MWLESFLADYRGAVIFVTHDRAFLQRVATRIVELDRGRLTSWPGNYETFLDKKEAWLANEQIAHEKFDKKLAQEEAWLRQGIKARRTRDEGRVKALHGDAQRARGSPRSRRPGSAAGRLSRAFGQVGVRGESASASRLATGGRARCIVPRDSQGSHRIDRAERIGQDHAAANADGRARARRRRDSTRHERADRVLRSAARTARPGAHCVRHRWRGKRHGDRERQDTARARVSARFSLPARARAVAREGALRRRAQPPAARAAADHGP